MSLDPCASTTPKPTKAPLVAVLKNAKLEDVQEVELPADMAQFPDMIELPDQTFPDFDRQFFRIGITDRRGFYKEGVSYRIKS